MARSLLYAALLVSVGSSSFAEWIVKELKDKMTDATHVLVSTKSISGPDAGLTAMCMGKKGDEFHLAMMVSFTVDYRRASSSTYEAYGKWRVDSEKSDDVEFDVSSANRRIVAFPMIRGGREQWLRKFAGHSRLLVQIPAYGRGLETLEFDLTGFDPATLAACYKP